MNQAPRWLPLALLVAACGAGTGTNTAPQPLTVLVDGQDYGADTFSTIVTTTVAGTWELVLYAHRPDDEDIADDEASLALHLVVDDLDQKSDGDTLVVSSTVTFTADVNAYVVNASSTPGADQDPTVRRAYVQQHCFCTPGGAVPQVVAGTLRFDSVSTTVEATIDLETSGGIPFYNPIFDATPHTTRFMGSFTIE